MRLSREASWANIRDKLSVGAFQAAHMLAPMPLAVTLGLNGVETPLVSAFLLSLNGNAITISSSLGEPWNTVAMARGHGTILLSTQEIWQNAPENVLAVRADWADRCPGTHRKLLRALLRATAWLADDDNGEAAGVLLSQPAYLGLPPKLIAAGRRTGGPVFHRYAANFPWRSQAIWLMG